MSPTSSPKPTIVLIPGSFALPEYYKGIVDGVVANGLEIHALHLPSVGTGPNEGREGDVLPTLYDDAAHIAEEITRLADNGEDVILVTHSYGGAPGTQSVKGLAKKAREAEGKPGGLIRLAYLTSLVPSVGQTAAGVLADVPEEQRSEMQVDEKGWLYHTNYKTSAALSFSDIPPEEGEAWAAKFTRHSSASFNTPLTYAGYRDVPVSYLLCEDDLVIPKDVQEAEIAMIERESGNKVHVTSIKSGHIPILSMPQEVISWITQTAEVA
ncbi:Alpha/beta hydrolase fold-1 [Xylaria grammica]|nr:Alpha/beta hydrolase fold-1 [Xylaria grammica]